MNLHCMKLFCHAVTTEYNIICALFLQRQRGQQQQQEQQQQRQQWKHLQCHVNMSSVPLRERQVVLLNRKAETVLTFNASRRSILPTFSSQTVTWS